MIETVPKKVQLTVPLFRVGLWSLIWGAYSGLIYFLNIQPLADYQSDTLAVEAALSFAMAMVIAFRVNRAYERWWEARTLWGTLVNISRNLAVKVQELQKVDPAELQNMRNLIVGFAAGLKDHLRNDPKLQRLPGFETSSDNPQHMPSYIVRHIYRSFYQWHQEGKMTDAQLWVLDREARTLLDVCGACERIKNTLMSISWRAFSYQCLAVYLLVLPWGLVDDFKLWTVPITVVVAYFAIAGEGIAEYVEEPFGLEEDHLDLDGLVTVIDSSVSEILAKD